MVYPQRKLIVFQSVQSFYRSPAPFLLKVAVIPVVVHFRSTVAVLNLNLMLAVPFTRFLIISTCMYMLSFDFTKFSFFMAEM